MKQFRALGGLAAFALLALTACGGSSNPVATESASAAASGAASGGGAGSLTIGSANFQENVLLAEIYAGALQAKGVTVTKKLNIGSRETYIPGLKDGSIDLIPEYSGVLLQYFDKGATAVSSADVYTALAKAVPANLTVLEQSKAEDKDAIVVSKQTAAKYKLTSIADLAPVAKDLVLGGPPEFKTRVDGIPGLASKYGVTFKEFKALDAGGPLTVNALKSGQVQAADIFTTDPSIVVNGFVVLQDPKSLYTAQNVLPLINKSKVTPAITEALNGVSAKLDTESLTALVAKAVTDKKEPADVAAEWLKTNGLV
ncbi:MAG TPA: ABC transporter substrate-binding protein [Kineosporiaceae bacterium]|nr:ABC transporter substrate-binding protein [Kineosporiaceae bacterium]